MQHYTLSVNQDNEFESFATLLYPENIRLGYHTFEA
jgi:hypothetical protein